ncbi:hypothetical protein KGF57_005006 [Candida theae]|uniref:Uncharacterized protein n=1 Tax=Candida theae TaxID=1198502 RepID=A0AAD5B9Z7_9ASCO|nr:uncharacterized protein KGF57_005006 [Candida theae]KAI5949008.1 hypothetical protein KGF57_005006 [Candida theae]
MSRAASTSSFKLQQPPPLFSLWDIHPITPSMTSFWINDQENLASPSSSSNSISNSSLVSKSGNQQQQQQQQQQQPASTHQAFEPKLDRQQAVYKTCEAKLKRMMMEDENYSFILNPCCDKIDCKFVKNAIMKDSRTRNVSRESVTASMISIDSELEEYLPHRVVDEGFNLAPLRTSSVEKGIQVQPAETNDEDTHSIYKDLLDELSSSITKANFQGQFEDRLARLKHIVRGRRNHKTKV